MSSAAGFKRPGVECQNCHQPFALFQAVDDQEERFDKLPDPFVKECPRCHHRATYAKESIGDLTVAEGGYTP